MTKLIAIGLLFAIPAVLPAQTPAQSQSQSAPATPAAQTAPAAVPTPNLSGAWKLNIGKSDFGQVPPPNSEYDIIMQNGDAFKIATASDSDDTGRHVYIIPITFGASETATPASTFSANDDFKILSSKAQWQAATLVVDQKMSYKGSPGTIHSVYTLSSDGKLLTRQTHYSLDLGEFDVTYIFDKQ